MSIESACAFASRHPRISVLVRNGKPLFYFITRNGDIVERADGPDIKAAMRDHDLNA